MKRLIFPLVLFLTYLILGIVTITNYGINWDEPAHFIRGQVFLRFLLTGKKDYAGLPEIDAKSYRQDFGYEFRDPNTNSTVRRSIYQHDDYGLVYYTQNVEKRGSHPAFSDVMSALFNYVLFVKLGIAPDVYSYNYYSIFVASLLVTGIYIWTKKYFGGFAAIVSTLSLALFPFFWAESHYNIKDVPETVFYALSVLVFYEAITSAKIKYIWYFAFVFAMAFATKFNALFILPTVLLWLFLRNFFLYRTSWREMFSFVKKNKAFLVFLVVPIIAVALWVLSFPAMLFEPRLIPASFSYYKTIGTTPVGNDWRYPLYYLFYTTPPSLLIFSIIALAGEFTKIDRKIKDILLLIMVWIFIPIVRVMIPGTAIYGGVRQIMEYIPAIAILSGIGANRLTKIPRMFIILTFIPLIVTLVKLHPNEAVYFNSLIGGLEGAKERNIPDWGQTLGNPYRQGILWINRHAEENAQLSLGFELWANLPHIWVRNDITYDNIVKSGPARLGEYVMAVMNPSDALSWYRMQYLETFIDPVYQVSVDGVVLLTVWKNDTAHLKEMYRTMEEEKIADVPITGHFPSFVLTLPKKHKILRIEFKNKNPSLCPEPARHELDDVVGIFRFYSDTSMSRFLKTLRASSYDFNGKVSYPRPNFLFAAEEGRAIVFDVAIDHPCYSTISGANVYVVKE